MSVMISRILFLVAFFGGVFLLFLKYQVASLEQECTKLHHKIVGLRETIHLLHAERAHATEPQRLHRLAQKHLKGWGSVHPTHVIMIDQVPFRNPAQASPTPGGTAP